MALRYSRMADITRLRQTMWLDLNDNALVSKLAGTCLSLGFSRCRDFIAILSFGLRSTRDNANDRISAFYDYLSAIRDYKR